MSHPPKSRLWSKNFLFFALAFAVFSGVAGLIHQLMWTRRMVDLLGASGESTARVFGCFFLGLSLGAALAAWLVPRTRRPWRLAGIAELLVAVTALGIFTLPSWSDGIWPALGPDALVDQAGGLIKLGLSAVTVGVPSFFMGLVLPALASAVMSGHSHMRREGVWLYALNTLGGALGLLLAAGFLIESLGASNTMLTAILLNGGIGLCCLWVDRHAPRENPSQAEPEENKPRLSSLFFAMAFLSGFGILSSEIAANQMIMLVATLSFHAPAAILFSVILLLALAALASVPFSRLTRRWDESARLSCVMAMAGMAFVLSPLGFMSVAKKARFLTQNASVWEFAYELGGIVLVTIGPAFFIAGLIFPLLLTQISGRGNKAAGQLAGLLALNGLGGFLGAELAYRYLLPLAGAFGALALVGVGYAVIAFLLALSTNQTRIAFVALAFLVSAIWLLKPVSKLPMVNPHLGFRTLEQWSGREGSVAVVEDKSGNRSILMSNQYMLGGTAAKQSQERQAWLPLLLHPSPREVGFIGLATGTTPGAALADERVERVTAIEISPLVNHAARRYFTEVNRDIHNNPRANIVIEDGRTFLAASREKYDVIAGDLFLPWGPGEARLFSLEHFDAVRLALKKGGIFCQWLPLYQLTPSQLETIAATFQAVFPETYLFASPAGVPMPVLALVGFRGEATEQGELLFPQLESNPLAEKFDDIEAYYLGKWHPTGSVKLNTLGNLAIELDAGRQRVTGHQGSKYFHGARWRDERKELERAASKSF